MDVNPSSCPRKVLIVDDHPAVREALSLRISRQPELQVCGEAGGLVEAMNLVSEMNPDVVVVDIGLKSGTGLELIRSIKSGEKPVKILVWSMYHEELYAERVLMAGASGYITKDQATVKIIEAIQCVLAGGLYFSNMILERVVVRVQSGNHRKRPEELLSDRELEVFRLIGEGLDTATIAVRLVVSPKTIDTYRFRMREKLQITDSKELYRRAYQWVQDSH